MTNKRRRQVKLIGEVLFNLLAIAFGALGLVLLIHDMTTPELRTKPFDNTLEPIIGHTATFIVFAVFCLFIIVSALLFMRRSIRLLRDNDYLETENPPFVDFL
ncbi:MAG: hypothetical protein GC204_05110 [Chloroflexi bacterium]|nr:hypothetical protein [Chloroflexota bacterium]